MNSQPFHRLIALLICAGALTPGVRVRAAEDAPPVVLHVTAAYLGANAQVAMDTVVAPLEQQLNGTEGMTLMRSTSRPGSCCVVLYFKPDVDLKTAMTLVRNRVALARPTLPEAVADPVIAEGDPGAVPVLWVAVQGPDGKLNALDLADYADQELRPRLEKLAGVQGVDVIGPADYAMQIRLDSGRLAAEHLKPDEVQKIVATEDVQVAAGRIGQPPVPPGDTFQFVITTGALPKKQVEDIVIKPSKDGPGVRLGDLGRVVEPSGRPDSFVEFNGAPGAALAIRAAPGTEAKVREAVEKELSELKGLPKGATVSLFLDVSRPGVRLIDLTGPDDISARRLKELADSAGDLIHKVPGVADILAVSDPDYPQRARLFVRAAVDKKADRDEMAARIILQLGKELLEARCCARDLSATWGLAPPRRAPVSLLLLDTRDLGRPALDKAAERTAANMAQSPCLGGVDQDRAGTAPALMLELDRDKMRDLHLHVAAVMDALAAALRLDRVEATPTGKSVEIRLRALSDDIKDLKVRTEDGKMVPLSAVVTFRATDEPPGALLRYQMYPAVLVTANAAADCSITDARIAARKAARDVPSGVKVLLWGAGMEQPEEVIPGGK